ncbi:hypothetical protein MKUB_29040 [Mycobacterium kubicae]|uniref:Uncharacterized protein n=1 Tax=Mycobacterium kubicae TaxID=120959 RepID=A0ABQ1BNW0_9MYCO|nr:hypothetical protein MKUB_29040 [Mycobacterium kubicae]
MGGRFWFSLDDGRGDVSGLAADIGIHVFGDGIGLLIGGRDTGMRVEDPVTTLVELARRFSDIRGTAWRVAELDNVNDLLPGVRLGTAFAGDRGPVGWLSQDDGRVTLGAAVPLGVLPARVAEFLAAIEGWSSVAICWCVISTKPWPTSRYGAGAAGLGVRRELPVVDRQRLHRQPRLCPLGRRCGGRRRACSTTTRKCTDTSSAANALAAAHLLVLVATGDGYRLLKHLG